MLRDQHVLITGGSSGIGLALGRQAAASGARVSLIGRDGSKLAAAADRIREAAAGSSLVTTAQADVSDEISLVAAIRSVEAVHGAVDILITSAGVARPGYFDEIPTAVFERTMAVNYFGTLYAIRAVTPLMRQRRAGRIVIISSGAALVGIFGYTAYAPSKFALRGLAESLRGELKPHGVGVSIVYPPDTDTPQLAEENRTKPAETKALTAAAGLWTAETVAKATLDGLRRGRFSITPGVQLTALSWLHSVIAPLLRWSFDRTCSRSK